MEELKCPICGEPTNVYMGNARKDRLCKKHAKELKDGLIEQCPDCGKWHKIGEACECKKKKATANDDLTCIICGEPSNGKHFCLNCWNKYKDKSIDIRISNCSSTEILDQYGNLTITCDDGRKVRSRAEALISNFFYNNKIRSVYEKPIFYEENGKNKTIHSDFYLPDYNLYIEYCELSNKPYLKKKEYTQSIYKKLGLDVLIMDDKDLNDIAGCLKPKLHIN